ncbi:MAG TPA: Zn-dependent alcohol dehydrogenase [Acidimicrobiales bacterium]|nr:Zn-dependent alcohol dehydrogenase [Acidimicrobiales bacterium]
MRAAVLRQCPGWLEVSDIDVDKPGRREVLIRTAAAGLCHSDLHFIEGKYPAQTPLVLGHESAGIVQAVGDDVAYVAPGDHVITCLSVFCGHCEYCLSGRPALCQSPEVRRSRGEGPRLSEGGIALGQFANLGSFAEEMLVHEHAVVKVSPDIPLDRAALIGCGVTTGLGAVFNTARVPAGATVAVIGCGGIGLNCVQGAYLAGASRIIAVDRLAPKLEMARAFGATDVVDASAGDPVAQVLELTAGGVEYAFEAIGLAVVAEQAFNMLRRGGTATVIGMIPPGEMVKLPGVAFLGEKKIQGSTMGSNRFRVDMPRYVELYLQGRLKLDELVSARISLDEVNDGFRSLQGGETARSVIVF